MIDICERKDEVTKRCSARFLYLRKGNQSTFQSFYWDYLKMKIFNIRKKNLSTFLMTRVFPFWRHRWSFGIETSNQNLLFNWIVIYHFLKQFIAWLIVYSLYYFGFDITWYNSSENFLLDLSRESLMSVQIVLIGFIVRFFI